VRFSPHALFSQKEFTHNGIKQANRTGVVDRSDGGRRAGFTENAGYCMVASAAWRAPAISVELRRHDAHFESRSCKLRLPGVRDAPYYKV
jgi:hypothetical protein